MGIFLCGLCGFLFKILKLQNDINIFDVSFDVGLGGFVGG
jgi:hypothetical protein